MILGALQSNGRVFLINPSGILFGAGAQVDVAGLVATSLNLSNADFLANRLKFTEMPGAGSVINQGNITTGSGGGVYLVGPAVTNSGIITTPQGEVILAAGNSVELVSPGTPNLRVEIAAADNEAKNLGQIISESGRVGIYAGLINQSGTIRADSAVNEGGKILLKATKNTTLEAGSVTTANGANGGSITVQSGDTTLVSGTAEAKGASGQGGSVQVLGNLVGVIEAASIDASGDAGGGSVLAGGDFQGRNPDVQNAFRTYVGSDVTIRADAITTGDGGKVVVWSDDATRAYGTISARGGAQSGNGGFVEVSGRSNLDFAARVSTGAPSGRAGTLLLDPQDITVTNTTTTNNSQLNADTPTAGNPAGAILFADGGSGNFTLSDEALEAQTGNIVLQATRDITLNNNLSGGLNLVNQGAGERVVLQAGRNITIGSPLTTGGAAIILEADSSHSPSGAADGLGQLFINATVASNSGKISLIGGGNPIQSGGGIRLGSSAAAVVDAGAGGIDVALSGNADLGVGSLGIITQILGNPVRNLRTTGPLVLGTATTAGTDGLGTGAITLLANSISNIVPNSAIILSNAPASTPSSFTLAAGSGGVTLSQPLVTFQPTTISTTGPLTINKTINTTNNDFTINASSVTLGPNGSIVNGSGLLTCTIPVAGCSPTSVISWDGGASTLFWFDAANWTGDVIPTITNEVSIASGFGTIVVNGAGIAKSLTSLSPLEIPVGDSLSLASSSTFANAFRLTGGSLTTSGLVTVGGATGSLLWSGGTIGGAGGTFELGAGSSGTLSGLLTLNLPFTNSGLLTLSGATVGGTGSIANAGNLTTAVSTSNAINVALTNLAGLGTIQPLSSLTLSSFPTNDGNISIGSGVTLSTNNAPLANSATGVIQSNGILALGTGSFSNGGTATFDGAYNVSTTNLTGGVVTFNGTASTGTLNFSGGTVTGSGDLSVIGLRPLLKPRLAARGLEPKDVTDVLLTHSHHDHSVNWPLFRHARIVIGADELAWSLEQPWGETPVPEFYVKAAQGLAHRPPLQGWRRSVPGITAHIAGTYAGMPRVRAEGQRARRDLHRRCRQKSRRAGVARHGHDLRSGRQRRFDRDDLVPLAAAPRLDRRSRPRRADGAGWRQAALHRQARGRHHRLVRRRHGDHHAVQSYPKGRCIRENI